MKFPMRIATHQQVAQKKLGRGIAAEQAHLLPRQSFCCRPAIRGENGEIVTDYRAGSFAADRRQGGENVVIDYIMDISVNGRRVRSGTLIVFIKPQRSVMPGFR
jgi:hypothetical protein